MTQRVVQPSIRTAIALLSVTIVMLVGLLVATQQPADATVFSCKTSQTSYRGWSTSARLCAEHGAGWYRSWAQAQTWNTATGAGVAANYSFTDLSLWYYCNTGICYAYDFVDRSGFVGVLVATTHGNNIGCPGASNTGKVDIVSVNTRYPDGVLRSWSPAEATGIAFNSNC